MPRRGDGYEFAELRAYTEGDDPRRIDWAATARAGDLQTRVMYEDRSLVLGGVIDASGSMHVGRARSLYDLGLDAARAWYDTAIDEDRAGRIVDGLPLGGGTLRGTASARVCSNARDARRDVPLARSLEVARATLARGAHLLVVSDFHDLDACETILRACAARYETIALVATDPWRDGLPLSGLVRLRDAETGAVCRVVIGKRERERFLAAVRERETRIFRRLRELGIRAALLDETSGGEGALLDVFGLR